MEEKRILDYEKKTHKSLKEIIGSFNALEKTGISILIGSSFGVFAIISLDNPIIRDYVDQIYHLLPQKYQNIPAIRYAIGTTWTYINIIGGVTTAAGYYMGSRKNKNKSSIEKLINTP